MAAATQYAEHRRERRYAGSGPSPTAQAGGLALQYSRRQHRQRAGGSVDVRRGLEAGARQHARVYVVVAELATPMPHTRDEWR